MTIHRESGPAASSTRAPFPSWVRWFVLAAVGLALVIAAFLAGSAGPITLDPPPSEPLPPPTETVTFTPTSGFDLPPRGPNHVGPPPEWVWWVAGALATVLMVLLAWWAIRRWLRRPRTVLRPPTVMPPQQELVELEWLERPSPVDVLESRTFDPQRAADDIIACWKAVEDAADFVGFPRKRTATPTEFIDAITGRYGDPELPAGERERLTPVDLIALLGIHADDASAAHTLLHLYHRARFDTATLAPGAATLARGAARTVRSRMIAAIGRDDGAEATL